MDDPKSVPELLAQLRARQIPSDQYAVYVRQFLDFKARKEGVPLSGKFELTPLCNLDCKMCYVHLNRQQMGAARLLSAEDWKAIMTQAAQMGMMEGLLTGGECLTYPHFEELYLHLHSLGVETAVYTNGILLEETRIAFLKAHPPKDIQVSLYGSSEEAYEKVTGHRQFGRVLENLKSAKAAGLPVHIAITPSVFMDGDVEKIIRLAHSLEIPFAINWSLFDPRENTGRQGQKMELSVDDYVGFYKLQRELTGQAVIPVDPAELPDPGSGACTGDRGLRCGGGRSSFSVGCDGTLYICGMLRDPVAYPLKTGFREAWRTIHEAAETYPVAGECAACSYRKECPTCVVHHQKEALPGQVNRKICERTLRMAAEGLLTIL